MLAAMKRKPLTLEQVLLTASGLVAIGMVAAVSHARYGFLWQNLAIHLAFAAAFVMSAYKDELGLPHLFGKIALLAMLLLSVLAHRLHHDSITLILSVVLMASAPYHLTVRQSWLLFAIANLAHWYMFNTGPQAEDYVVAWLTLVALQGFAISSSLARQRDRTSQQMLARQNNELLAARAVMARQSQSQERLRIAGELHDTLGHRLTALQLQLEALVHESPDALKPRVQGCKALAADLLEDVRSIVREVSRRDNNDLAAALQELASLTPGIAIRVHSTLPTLGAELSQQLVFCFQEAIHNAIRHGGATQIDIRYGENAFEICDNGRGLRSARASPGFGLRNIRSRLAPFGGSATLAATEPAAGCTLTLTLPQAPAT